LGRKLGATECALFKSRDTGLTNKRNYIMGVKSFGYQSPVSKRVLLSAKPGVYQPQPLSDLRDGLRLRREMNLYLDAERRRVDQQLGETFRLGLFLFPIGSSEITKTPGYWNKLVDACTTIGSKSLERIEKRLRIIGHGLQWEPDFDYRTLSHQLYLATDQARKLQNSYQQRRKCVRAVLKNIDENEKIDGRYKTDLGTVKGDSPVFFEEWFAKAFEYFTSNSNVQPKFHDMYRKEWSRFCEDFLKVSLTKSKYEEVFDNIYIEYLAQLQTRLRSGSYRFGTTTPKTNDFNFKENVTLNLKLGSGKLVMIYEFKKRPKTELSSISTDLLLEISNKCDVDDIEIEPILESQVGIKITLPNPKNPEMIKQMQGIINNVLMKA
jgi:hypothetical protein